MRLPFSLPAGSAVPGWPAGVVLPDDPFWKQNHAASVRQFIRDGVDPPLAALFLQATCPDLTASEGVCRARSASEVFSRRLETLPQTKGRFRLNVELSIPFDGMSRMEVDLVDAKSRVVVEIDGPQHLAGSDAYRRDRRKDRLLQENGYLVLRFLAGDQGMHLDEVLDAICAAMANRCRRE